MYERSVGMKALLYFIIAILSTTMGAMTGMGGGVIIKPVLDVLHDFDAATISLLSSLTVFTMSLVSVLKQIQQKTKIDYGMAVALAAGSVVGGGAGQKMLTAIIAGLNVNSLVLVVQNILLAILIVGVFFYMLYKSKIPTLGLKGKLPALIAGVFLGIVSSFLGIGGGPINVALLIYLFSFDTKTATYNSIITILFAQVSKLGSVLVTTGFAAYNLSLFLPMAIGAVVGGFVGSKLNKQLPEKTVEYCFNGVQVLVFAICIFNIFRNLVIVQP